MKMVVVFLPDRHMNINTAWKEDALELQPMSCLTRPAYHGMFLY